jgi:hypothetical protein
MAACLCSLGWVAAAFEKVNTLANRKYQPDQIIPPSTTKPVARMEVSGMVFWNASPLIYRSSGTGASIC